MKKKVIALIAVAALSVSALTGCGSNETAAQTSEAAATTANPGNRCPDYRGNRKQGSS